MLKRVALLLAGTGLIAAPAHAEAGDVLLRVRGIMVAPNESSGAILPGFPGEKARVNNSVMPEIDITYMATKHVGVELIAATTKHDMSGVRGTTGGIGKLGSTWVLPPTLTVQYHPIADGPVRPYVGVGLNYTMFYSEKSSSGLEAAVGKSAISMKDSLGWAAQAGVDIDLNPTLFLNFDVKYLDIDTTATINTTDAGRQRLRVSLDPLVFGVGVGMRL